MNGLEELRKKLEPLFDAEKGLSNGMSLDPSESYMVSDGGSVNLLSKSYGVYNINVEGLQKRTAGLEDDIDASEKVYRCASHEMHVFGTIGCGASSVVQRAIHIPLHRILALKKINVFEKEKRQQLLTEIRTLCEAPCYEGLVEFHGAFYNPDSGQISIALEYMDGGSVADILKIRTCIPEPVLSSIFRVILQGLDYLHGVRRLVHRDIKPANLLINLKGEPKITDFGISAGLENSMAMCATFVGTVTYMSPERICNEHYSYPADIWSLGLALFECGTGRFPYEANEGPASLMLQILYDPSPSPPKNSYSPEFCSFVDACLQKDANARPTAEQLLSHPFITNHANANVDLESYVRSVFDPMQKLKEIADMLAVHYYLLFDGADELWHHVRNLYVETSSFSFSGTVYKGVDDIFRILTDIRNKLLGNRPCEKLVHVIEKLQCRPHGRDGIAIRSSGSFILGNHFLILGSGVEVEGMPNVQNLVLELPNKRVGRFYEQFVMEPNSIAGSFLISKQQLHVLVEGSPID